MHLTVDAPKLSSPVKMHQDAVIWKIRHSIKVKMPKIL